MVQRRPAEESGQEGLLLVHGFGKFFGKQVREKRIGFDQRIERLNDRPQFRGPNPVIEFRKLMLYGLTLFWLTHRPILTARTANSQGQNAQTASQTRERSCNPDRDRNLPSISSIHNARAAS